MHQDIITSWLSITKINTAAKRRHILNAECILIFNVFIINEHLLPLLHMLCCFFFLFSFELQLGWRLSGWLRGSNLLQGQCNMFLLFTYTLILVLIMFVLSTRKKRTGKSEKPQPESVRFNSQHYHSEKKKRRLHTSMHTHPSTPQDESITHTYTHLKTDSKHHSSLKT